MFLYVFTFSQTSYFAETKEKAHAIPFNWKCNPYADVCFNVYINSAYQTATLTNLFIFIIFFCSSFFRIARQIIVMLVDLYVCVCGSVCVCCAETCFW